MKKKTFYGIEFNVYMNKQEYNKMITALEWGKHVIVECESTFPNQGDYQIISPYKDRNGYYRCSGWSDSIEEAKQNIGDGIGYSKVEESKNWKFIDTWMPEYKTIEPGTPVTVRKDAQHWCEKFNIDWDERLQDMMGKKCFIEDGYGNDYPIWNEDRTYWELLPIQALDPYIEEDTKKQELLTKADELIAKAEELKEEASNL